MRMSEAGIAYLKQWEKCEAEAYLDVAGVPTIGYGTTKGVKLGMYVTEDQAEQMLRDDIYQSEAAVNTLVKVMVLQFQFDALVSLTYNIGVNAFRSSALLVALNRNKTAEAATQFARWNLVNGKVCAGLVARRIQEKEMFEGRYA